MAFKKVPDNTEEFPQEGTPEFEALKDTSTEVATQEKRTVSLTTIGGTTEGIVVEDLRTLDFNQLAEAFGIGSASEVIGTDQYGPVLENKMTLVGVPLLLVHWNFYSGDFGEFVSLWVLTKDNQRYIVNDGSAGIYAQLRALTDEKGVDSMVACAHGLRVSEYTYTDPMGNERPAKTYYIDTKL